MFKSVNLIKFINETDSSLWNIIDDGFEELIEIFDDNQAGSLHNQIISVYERRKLNVAANIILLFKFLEKEWCQSIENQIWYQFKYNKNYKKYHNDVEKYLLLI